MQWKHFHRSVAGLSGLLLVSLPWACLDDHRPPTANELLLINCRSGWMPVGVYSQGDRVGDAAPACYRMIFQSNGQLIFNRQQCSSPDTATVVAEWSLTSNSLSLPYRPGNIYGPPTGGLVEELTSSSLKFSYRGGPDKITEVWACP
ncbi:hypothetical protein [Larkinella rosea]|uniref:Lipocalin-like domain-containing protein n=1 Tax=Larkinella rosea TaxID=2025312 RepID=A0A3P1BFY2_9BACT|nr:hypothetical protein [Larkinella rosea]RRA99999.1 hypothetical protein EHT25_25585 [Larkinella rosea]